MRQNATSSSLVSVFFSRVYSETQALADKNSCVLLIFFGSPINPLGRTAVKLSDLQEVLRAQNIVRSRSLLGDGIHKFWNRQYSDATARFHSARESDATNAASAYFLALTYRRIGKTDMASQSLAAALRGSLPADDCCRLAKLLSRNQSEGMS